jgi:selenocysteine lyase/cysteine desulfurase
MPINRRNFLTGIGGLAAMSTFSRARVLAHGGSIQAKVPASSDETFPRKGDFAIPEGLTYINGAYTHPLPIAAAEAMHRDAEWRSHPGAMGAPDHSSLSNEVKSQFAALINAKPSEISYIPNTSTGENLVVNSLELAGSGANVVTDALHFEGAILHLQAMQRNHGLDVRIAMPRDGRIEMKDLERLIDAKTKLVEISLVAMYNGFQHDLKAVCDLAHAHGAYVYADIVQAAGATPIDVRASGLDFCACSSFKWLMADFGLGFLYAREELLGRIRPSQYGYHSAESFDTHFLPYDEPASTPFTWELGTDASAHFEVGSNAYAPMAALGVTLPYIRKLGVERIEAYRQPMLERLRKEMPRLGYDAITPAGTKSALLTFTVKDRAPVLDRLKKANINVRLGAHFIRVSPSVYNDMGDIDRLLEALS